MANSYPVARIYKDTGVFECIKAVEKQEQLYSNWSGQFNTNTGTYILNNGWNIQINKDGSPLSTPYKLIRLRVNGGASAGYIDYIWLTTDASNNVTATTMSSAEDVVNYIEGKQLVFILCSEPTPSTSTNQNVIVTPKGSNPVKFTSSAGQFYNPNSGIIVNFSDVIGCTPSISRQGTATFSKIVENQELLPITMTSDEVNQYFSIGTWDNTKYSMVAVEKGTTNVLDWWTEFVADGSSIFMVDFGQYQNPSKYPSLVYYKTTSNSYLSYSGSLPITVTDLFFHLNLAPTADKSNIDILFGLGDINNPNFRFRFSIGSNSLYFTGGNSTYGYKSVPQVSISKDGVLTCAKLVEGDYDTEQKFIGTYSGNKLTFNNGYTVEVVSSYGGSTAVGSFNTGQITLSGYTSEQPSPSTSGIIYLVLNGGNISVSSYNPNGTGTWNDDKTLYIYSIIIQSYTGWVTGNVEYLKITNTLTNTSVYYHNTSSIKNNFYEEESGDDGWYTKSIDRFQNYLIDNLTEPNYFLTNTGEQFMTSDNQELIVKR